MPGPQNTFGNGLDRAIQELDASLKQGWFHRLFHRGQTDRAFLDCSKATLTGLRELAGRQAEVSVALQEHQRILQDFNHTLSQHEQRLAEWAQTKDALSRLSAQVGALAAHATAVQTELTRLSTSTTALDASLLKQAVATTKSADRLTAVQGELTQLSIEKNALESRWRTQTEAAVRTMGELGEQLPTVQSQIAHLLRETGPDRPDEFARFYLAFENEFRGSREEIAGRHAVYLPHLKAAAERTGGHSWVDLGCGRGEWLEILRENGFDCLGVDNSPAMLQACQKRNLAVQQADVLEFLEKVPAGSLTGINAFHLIEHLPYRTVLALIDAAYAALAPGGCLILETPNPQNIAVGACNFYIDVTHQRPIPPMTGEFIVRYAGFARIEVLPLHAAERYAERDQLPTVTEREYCQMFYGPRDYAIIATK